MSEIIQEPLPYADTAVEPVISAKTNSFHYGKHHAGYVNTLKGLVAGTKYEGLSLGEIVVASRATGDTAVFNNAAHDSVGGQPTVGGDIDFEKVAEELGYNVLLSPQDQYVNRDGIGVDEVAAGMSWLVTTEEQSKQCKPDHYDELPKKPNFILFKVAKGARKDLGRPKELPQVNKALFMETLSR